MTELSQRNTWMEWLFCLTPGAKVPLQLAQDDRLLGHAARNNSATLSDLHSLRRPAAGHTQSVRLFQLHECHQRKELSSKTRSVPSEASCRWTLPLCLIGRAMIVIWPICPRILVLLPPLHHTTVNQSESILSVYPRPVNWLLLPFKRVRQFLFTRIIRENDSSSQESLEKTSCFNHCRSKHHVFEAPFLRRDSLIRIQISISRPR